MRALKFLVFIFVFYYFLLYPIFVFAARSLTVTSNKDSLFGDEEMVITASQSGFTNGETIYIKGAFYQLATPTSYFGYTKTNDTWIKNSASTTSQRQITIGSWDGTLTVKTDFSDSGYKGEGDYQLKVGFYYLTSGGNLSSVNWSNSLSANINEPDPTPTSVPTNSPTIASNPTPTRTPTPTPTIKPSVISVTPLVTKAGSASATPTSSSLDTSVLGAENNILSPSPKQDKNSKMPSLFAWGKLFIIMGVVIICSACGILMYKKYRQEKELEI